MCDRWIYRNLTINNGYVFFKLSHIFEMFFLVPFKNTSMQTPKAEQASVLHVNRLKTSIRTCFSFGAWKCLKLSSWSLFCWFYICNMYITFFPLLTQSISPEDSEKKRNNYQAYRSFLNREGPKALGSKEIPQVSLATGFHIGSVW